MAVEIYGLFDPRTNELRYVGKANDSASRFRGHMREARRRKSPVYIWIRELFSLSLMPYFRVLSITTTELWPMEERRQVKLAVASGSSILNVNPGGNAPKLDKQTQRKNGKRVADLRARDPKIYRMWYLKKALGIALRKGELNAETLALMKSRPDVFGTMRGYQ